MTNALGAPPIETRGGSFEDGLANGHKLLDQHPAIALHQAETLLGQGPEPRALELAAAALRKLGRFEDAERAELSGISASFAIPDLDAAAVAGQDGRTAESRTLIERVLGRQPGNLLALTMAAELDIDEWRPERAEDRLRIVLARAPAFLRAIMLLGKALSSQARPREAIAVVEPVLQRKPNNLIALRTLAQLYAEANDHDKSAAFYRRTLDLDPEKLDLWIVYAQELRMLGRKDESIAAFRRAISLDPHSGAAWWGLANYFRSAIGDADRQAMEDALGACSESPEDGGPLHVALAVLAEARGDFAESFRHVAEGKALRARVHPFDSPAATATVDEMIGVLERREFPDAPAGSPDSSPIFIVGMPRSGTTLLERVLSRHSQIEAGGELPILPRLESWLCGNNERTLAQAIASTTADELTKLGTWYVDRSRDYRASDKPKFIDKLNYNWTRTGLIRLMLPNARIIDLRRDALDCCWSNFKMMFAEGHVAANDQQAIARFYRDYVRMMEAVDTALPGGILRVGYEDLVNDLEGQARRILDLLGLDYEPQCIDFHLSTAAVATPSSEQVRRPINRDSIGSAEPYRQWLGPMIEELGDLAGQA